MAKAVDIDKINRTNAVQIRSRLNQDAVERYMENFDQLPPIVLFDVRGFEEYILADGFHRIEAAIRLGHETIKSDIMTGSLNEAMEYAVKANIKHGVPLSTAERESAVLRLKRLHPQWSYTQIGNAMGLSHSTVSMTISKSKVRKEVTGKLSNVSEINLRNVHQLPKSQWVPVLEAAEKRGWDNSTVRLAVKNLKDPKIPQKLKNDIVAGKADPLVTTNGGELAFPIEAIKTRVAAATKEDAALALLKVEETLVKIEKFSAKQIISELDAEQAQRIVDEMPEHISFLDKLLSEAKTARKPKEVSA